MSVFPMVDKDNYDYIRRRDAIFIIGGYSSGHNYYNEDFKDTLLQSNELQKFLDRINFAAVDYDNNWDFCENFIEDLNSWDV